MSNQQYEDNARLSSSNINSEIRHGRKGTITASLAALGSIILASSCCLPVVPFVFGAAAAGSSAFLVKIRPFLMLASVLFIAFGFYQRRRAKQCRCKPSILSAIVLWFSTVLVIVFMLFPQAAANILASLAAK